MKRQTLVRVLCSTAELPYRLPNAGRNRTGDTM